MIISHKVTCFHPSPILPWYVTVSFPAFSLPSFLLSAGKDRRNETFPPLLYSFFFFSLTRLVKTSQKEEVCHFSPTTNQQKKKKNSFSALKLSPFPQRPLQKSSSASFDLSEMKVVKGHHCILRCILQLLACSKHHIFAKIK